MSELNTDLNYHIGDIYDGGRSHIGITSVNNIRRISLYIRFDKPLGSDITDITLDCEVRWVRGSGLLVASGAISETTVTYISKNVCLLDVFLLNEVTSITGGELYCVYCDKLNLTFK